MSLQKVMKDIEEIESSLAALKMDLTSTKPTSQTKMGVYYVEDDSVTEPTMVVYIPKVTTKATSEETTRGSTPPAGVNVYGLNSSNSWKVGTYLMGDKISNNGFTAVIQSDGNLVIYNSKGAAVWASGTSGNPNAKLAVQSDGNIVIYRSNGSVAWASNVFNFRDSNYTRLFIDSDGKLKVAAYIYKNDMLGNWLSDLKWKSH